MARRADSGDRETPAAGPATEPRLWSPTAAVNALKTTIGILVAWGIALAYQWPSPFMAPMAVLFLQTPFLGASMRKGLLRAFGTLAGASAVLVLLSALVQERWPMIAGLSIIIGFCIYQVRNSRYGYAWFMACVNVVVIASDAADYPSLAFQLAVDRTSEAIVGILVVLVINGVLWPTTAGRTYDRSLAAIMDALVGHLRALGAAMARATAGGALPSLPPVLRGASVRLHEILASAQLDSGRFRRLRRTYEAQIQTLNAMLGSLVAFGEGLRLAGEGSIPVLEDSQRKLLASAARHLGDALDALRTTSPAGPAEAVAAALAAARESAARLTRAAAATEMTPRSRAIVQASAHQLAVLIDDVGELASAAAALRADKSLPAAALPPEPRMPLVDRLRRGLPYALVGMATFWTATLIYIGIQWPPVGLMGLMFAVVVVGIEAISDLPAQHPGRRIALGALIGCVVMAPIHLVVMPRLDGFFELALVLLPFYYALLYFYHALPPLANNVFLGIALMGVVMAKLEPTQTYSAVAYFGTAASLLSGFAIGLTLLSILLGMPAQERLRRTLKALVTDLDRTLADLRDRTRSDFDRHLQVHEQRLRGLLQRLAQVAPLAYSPHCPANDRDRIQALLSATEALFMRTRALQHARSRWSEGNLPPGAQCLPNTDLGRRFRGALQLGLRELLAKLDRPDGKLDLTDLHALRDWLRRELARIDRERRAADEPDAYVYLLAVAGHYIGVARALRELAEVIDAIDWVAWGQPRF